MTLDGNVSGESCWLCSVTKLSTSKWAMRGGLPDGPSMLAFGHRASAEAKDAQASTYACGPITPNSGKPSNPTGKGGAVLICLMTSRWASDTGCIP